MPKRGEFGLRKFYKKPKWTILTEGIWCYLSVQQAVTQMVGDRGGKAAVGGYQVQSLKEPHFVLPILEP